MSELPKRAFTVAEIAEARKAFDAPPVPDGGGVRLEDTGKGWGDAQALHDRLYRVKDDGGNYRRLAIDAAMMIKYQHNRLAALEAAPASVVATAEPVGYVDKTFLPAIKEQGRTVEPVTIWEQPYVPDHIPLYTVPPQPVERDGVLQEAIDAVDDVLGGAPKSNAFDMFAVEIIKRLRAKLSEPSP